jgi:hypothetical protein
MKAKKLLITGLSAGSTEEGLRSWLSYFGQIDRVEIIRDGNAADPVALLEMSISDGAAAFLLSHLANYWHEGKLVTARLLHH